VQLQDTQLNFEVFKVDLTCLVNMRSERNTGTDCDRLCLNFSPSDCLREGLIALMWEYVPTFEGWQFEEVARGDAETDPRAARKQLFVNSRATSIIISCRIFTLKMLWEQLHEISVLCVSAGGLER
jgi:hypothetical protein